MSIYRELQKFIRIKIGFITVPYFVFKVTNTGNIHHITFIPLFYKIPLATANQFIE